MPDKIRIILCVALLVAAGCKPPPKPVAPVAPAAETVSAPLALAQEAVRQLQAERAALKANDQKAADAAIAVLRGLSDEAELKRRVRAARVPEDKLERGLVELVRSWGRPIASVLDQARINEATIAAPAAEDRVRVNIPATAEVGIVVTCAAQPDGAWRLLDVAPKRLAAPGGG